MHEQQEEIEKEEEEEDLPNVKEGVVSFHPAGLNERIHLPQLRIFERALEGEARRRVEGRWVGGGGGGGGKELQVVDRRGVHHEGLVEHQGVEVVACWMGGWVGGWVEEGKAV